MQSAEESLRNAQISYENQTEQLDDYTVTAPITGTIVDKNYNAGEITEANQVLCTIYDLSYLTMTLSVDELDIANIQVGQTVAVTAAALNRGDTVLLTADSPSAAGAEAQQPEDGTDAEISAGGGDAETAGDESSQYVSVQVTTGISDDSYIEITSGLQEGDTVVYIPTTSSDSDMGMMGGMPGGGGGGMGGGPGGF